MCTFSPLLSRQSKQDRNCYCHWGENLLIETGVILLHGAPVAPAEGHRRWAAEDLENLPCKGRHHAFESLVAGVKARMKRAVELVGLNDGIVCSDLEHVFAGLWWAAVDREAVVGGVNGAPILEVHLVGR